MKPKQKRFAIFLSIVITATTFLFIEYMHFDKGVQQKIFPNAGNLDDLRRFFGRNYYEGIKTVMLLIFQFFVVYVSFFVLLFEAIAIAYFIATSRWTNPKVFISYKYSGQDAAVNTNKIAATIKSELEKKGFKVLYFKYNNQLEHDSVNFEIQNLLRRSKAMVVVPDPYHPSYVNAEIASAVTANKPVYIIKHTKDQRLPDTANSGHTVLLLDKLKKGKYKPLTHILQYVHRLWYTRLYIIWGPLVTFLYPFMSLDDENGGVLKGLGIFALVTVALVFFKVPLVTILIIVKLIITVIGGVGSYLTTEEIVKNIALEKVIKQSMINDRNTYDYFKEAGFSKNVLDAIDQVGLVK